VGFGVYILDGQIERGTAQGAENFELDMAAEIPIRPILGENVFVDGVESALEDLNCQGEFGGGHGRGRGCGRGFRSRAKRLRRDRQDFPSKFPDFRDSSFKHLPETRLLRDLNHGTCHVHAKPRLEDLRVCH
jgi:hypothetical protein